MIILPLYNNIVNFATFFKINEKMKLIIDCDGSKFQITQVQKFESFFIFMIGVKAGGYD
jgi:hypothetical protein